MFERLHGVANVQSGYAGGNRKTAHYEMVGSGRTGHAECVRVEFDPAQISFGTILKVFFFVANDPTQLNYQGPDAGTQYRSEIFCLSAEQKRIAEVYIRILDRAKVFPKPISTRVTMLEEFFPAETHHQGFLDRHHGNPCIVRWDLPKIELLKKDFPALVSNP